MGPPGSAPGSPTPTLLCQGTQSSHDNVPCGSITGGGGSLVGGGIIAFRMVNPTFNGNIENSVGPHHSCGAN